MTRNAAKMDWSQWDPMAGLRGMLGVALPLILGFSLGYPSAGAIAAGGAMNLGLGSFDRENRASTRALFAGSLFMALSTLAGTLSHGLIFSAFLAALWGFTGGLFVALGPPSSFIGIKVTVAFIIANGYPSSLKQALGRALLILAGTLLQTLLAHLENKWMDARGGKSRKLWRTPSLLETWQEARRQLQRDSPALQHALRLGAALLIAEGLSHTILSQNAYWIPLTVLIVLKPDFDQTFNWGLSRMAGTMAGAGLTTLIAVLLRPNLWTLGALSLLFAWLSFLLLKVNYALYASCITAYVVFLISFIGLPEMTIVIHRLIATLVGGFFALALYALWPKAKAAA